MEREGINSYNLRDIQFISKNDKPNHLDKESIYTYYYIMRSSNVETKEDFIRRTDFSEVSSDDIAKQYNKKLKSISSPSKAADYYAYLHELLTTPPYMNSEFATKINDPLPNYTITVKRIAGVNDEVPDNIIVWECNKRSPILTGFFFEEMFARAIGCESNVKIEDKIKNVLRGANAKTTVEQLKDFFERNHITESMNKNIFIDILAYAICARCVKSDFDINACQEALSLLEYVRDESNEKYLNEYLEKLCKCELARTMQREKGMIHSKSCKNDKFEGEIDFLSNQSITDVKCYKKEAHTKWFAQLYIYRSIVDDKSLKLRLVNLIANEYYEYNTV